MIETNRLILREWEKTDLEPFANLNACNHVCKFLPTTLSKLESNSLATKIITDLDKYGFGLFAIKRKDTKTFIGFTGLNIPGFWAHFMPAVEIGWRLAYNHWGQGFATEAAIAVRNYAFNELKLKELASFTTIHNHRSEKIMQKIGMTHNEADNFNHPKLPKSHPLSPHILYRIKPTS